MIEVNDRNSRKVPNMFKVSNKNNERRHWRYRDVFIVNIEHMIFSSISIANFEQLNVSLVFLRCVSKN